MTIDMTVRPENLTFGDLHSGVAFFLAGDNVLFMSTEEIDLSAEEAVNAIDLETGDLCYFDHSQPIVLAKVKIVGA